MESATYGIECGASFPPPDVIDKIAETLKTRPSQLFDENGCAENIISSDKDSFVSDLSKKILSKMEPKIKKDITEAIKTIGKTL